MALWWGFGVAMLTLGALCFHQHFWVHGASKMATLGASFDCILQCFGASEACFRQACVAQAVVKKILKDKRKISL